MPLPHVGSLSVFILEQDSLTCASMMGLILEGLVFGLGLAVSLGPIFFALTQTSIERGVLPGLTVGLGIWISDFLFIVLFYLFIHQIKDDIESEAFSLWMGLSGALVLLGFGLMLILKKPSLEYKDQELSYKNYFGFWLKGFLVNTVNPFTVVFWMGVISTYVIGRNLHTDAALTLLSTILTVIIVSDAAKVLLANSLKKKLRPKHINLIGNLSGAILIGFGLFLGYSVI